MAMHGKAKMAKKKRGGMAKKMRGGGMAKKMRGGGMMKMMSGGMAKTARKRMRGGMNKKK